MTTKSRILFTSCAVLLAPLAGKIHAQLVVSPTMNYTGEGGTLAGDNLGTTGTAFAKDLIAGGAYPAHTIAHVNDGIFGNSNSWIGDSADSFVGIGFGSAQTIAAFAFGRSNVTSGDPCGGGVCTDRSVGLYTIEFTTDPDPAVNFLTNTWTTLGTISLNTDFSLGLVAPWKRHQYDIVTPVSATGFRIIAPGGAAIDELEFYTHTLPPITPPGPLSIVSAAGFTVSWNNNDGDFFNPANPAPAPRNLATNATAFASSQLGTQLGIPFHLALNLNDGFYGNDRSWISGDSDPNVNPIAGVAFGGARHVSSLAWGRDNGNTVGDCCGGVLTDRTLGTYTLESLDPADGTTWVPLGTITYNNGSGDEAPGGGFTPWLRHQFELATAGGGLRSAGIRLRVPTVGLNGGTDIDEIEVYATKMTWSNGAGTRKWNLDTDANFSGAADAKFLTEDNVFFGNTGAGNVTIEGDLTPTSVTVDASGNYSFTGTGSIAGDGTLTKAGTGTLFIGTVNTYTGATNANGGTLQFGVSEMLSELHIGDGAVVTLDSTAPAPALLLGEGGGVQAVPEPGTAALVLGGLAALLGLRRRQA